MICVYPSDCTDFSTNGLGLVSPQSAIVTETLNGEWELTIIHPIDEDGKWLRLQEGNILVAPVPSAMTPKIGLVTQQYQNGYYDTLIYRVIGGRLNLRSGKSTSTTRLGQYPAGTEIIVLDDSDTTWFEVACPDGKHGYMMSEFLEYERTDRETVQEHVGFQNRTVEARQLRDQPFRIYRVVPDLTKITVYARHIFYDLLDNMLKKVEVSDSAVGAAAVQSISEGCLSSHPFTFYSDLTGTAEDVCFENINPIEAILGENGITDKYQAELARDWYDAFLVSRVGVDSDVHIREKKNLLGISYDIDETDVVTRIMPTGEDADGNVLYLPELYMDSPNIDAYAHPKWIHVKVSEAKEVAEGENYKSLTSCFDEMRSAAQAEFDKGCDLPTVTLKVDFLNLADVEEYKQYAHLQNIYLGDSVRVIAKRIGVEVSMRMTQYSYDCLTKKYTSVTLGTVADTLEGTMISARQLANGSITGAKIAINSIGTGQLQNGAVGNLQIKNAAIGTAHIQEAAITRAHIAEALIDTLNANAITAVTARIQQLAAGSISTEELYASIAAIAVAQLTTANIIHADIEWANIDELATRMAEIGKAQINTANITAANINWAAISSLSAAMAEIVNTQIGTADIDWAHIKDLATDTAIITQGVGGELYIAKLAVTEANLVSLTVGELVVKGEDEHFYSVSVDGEGNVVSTLKQLGNDDIADVSIDAGEKLIEGSVTADALNVQDIFASNAIIKSLIAANLDVDTLFARQATINALNAMDITSNTYLRLMVDSKAEQADVDELDERISAAELKITDSAIIQTIRGSTQYQEDLNAISETAQTAIEQTNAAIALKADRTVTDDLSVRMTSAEQKITPEAITTAVRQTGLYQYEPYEGRNYALDSNREFSFVDGVITEDGDYPTEGRFVCIPLSPDLQKYSNGQTIYISFDMKRTNIMPNNTGNNWLDVRIRYEYGNATAPNYAFWGYSLTTTTPYNDGDWVRMTLGYMNINQSGILALPVIRFGTNQSVTGTLQVRNVMVEYNSKEGQWREAPEDDDSVAKRLAQAESNIKQNANAISLAVTQTDLQNAIEEANISLTPEGIIAAVRSTEGLFKYEPYEGRNYVKNSAGPWTFINGNLLAENGQITTSRFLTLHYTEDLWEHSNHGAILKLSFDMRLSGVTVDSNAHVLSAWIYYHYLNNGTTPTTGRGWYINRTGSNVTTGWERWSALADFSSYSPTGLAYLYIGLSTSFGITGQVEIRNVMMEVTNSTAEWSPAPEDPDSLARRIMHAESAIKVNANGISTKVGLNEIISRINQSAESISIAASKINLNGVVTANNRFRINTDGSMSCTNGTFSGTLSAATGTFAGSLSAATGTFAGSLSAATGTFAGSLSAATGTFSGTLQAGNWTFNSSGSKFQSGSSSVNMNVSGYTANFSTTNLNAQYGSTSYNDTIVYGGAVKLNCASTGQSVSARNCFWGSMSYNDVCFVCDQGGGSYSSAAGNLGTTDNRWDILWVDTIHYNSRASDSSREIKHDIQALPSMGETLDKLKPVSFVYNDDRHEWKHFGLIYEDTEDVLPEICHEQHEGDSVTKGISYEDLIAALLKEVQELRARVAALEASSVK